MPAADAQPELSPREALIRAYRDAITNHIRAHTEGTNVNTATLLATDYLNHFSEVVMLLELLPSAPAEIAGDLAAWRPRSYEEHFAESGFRDRSLAIAAYQNAPCEVRDAFDAAIAELVAETEHCLQRVLDKARAGKVKAVRRLCGEAVPRLRRLIERAAAIANGDAADPRQPDGEDSLTAGAGPDAQARIDALFA